MSWENAKELWPALSRLSPFEKYKIEHFGKIMPVGKEMREGFTAPIMFYVFWCSECEDFSYDYLHGHNPYLICHRCDMRIDAGSGSWLKEIRALWCFLKIRFKRS